MGRMLKVPLLAALVVAVLSPAAFAAIVSTSGDVVQIAPPPSVDFGALQSDTDAFAFDEQQGVTLSADLPVNITSPGTYDDLSDLTPGVIPAGTVVDSHFVHSDNVGVGGGPHVYEGSVVVDGDILGIAVRGTTLSAGDAAVGAPGTVYPTGKFGRGVELGLLDVVIEQADLRTVTIHFETERHADQIRIITVGERPGGEGCTPGFWKQPQHFDSWTAPYDPGDLFSAHFEDAFPGLTLLDVLNQGGGGLNALGRHTVSALLNAASVDFAFTPAEVIAAFNEVFPGTTEEYIALKNQFEAENETTCPLN